ncbi:putative endonuclease lcl3 [Onygenales sp. PD_40]|nr:putative endonuclease lcl3 [Onygenales sp. PD_40]KAK2770874.1 putative endonuclease lcl3 [Emmonsiellopsis sp. PD_33]
MRWLLWASGPQEPPADNQTCTNCSTPITTTTTAPSNDNPSPSPSPSSRKEPKTDWTTSLTARDWSREFKDPRNLIPTLLLTSGILFCAAIHRRYLRRIPAATNITPGYFHKRSLLGRVTSVGDGDNFRMYHTPGGWLAGWEWMPVRWRQVPRGKKELKDRTIHIRLAGIDAPELPHFGRPAQPFSSTAHTWLTTTLANKRVRAYPYRPDHYGRVVATVYIRSWRSFFLRRDVGLQMLRAGLATVYEAKSGAEFGGKRMEGVYREAERGARKRGRGMWAVEKRGGKGVLESPREYKTRMAGLEGGRGAGASAAEEEAGVEGKGKKG